MNKVSPKYKQITEWLNAETHVGSSLQYYTMAYKTLTTTGWIDIYLESLNSLTSYLLGGIVLVVYNLDTIWILVFTIYVIAIFCHIYFNLYHLYKIFLQ